MENNMRYNIFFLMVFFIMFANIPQILSLNFIGNFMGKNLSLYPILLGLFYTIYHFSKTKENIFSLTIEKRFLVYVTVYIGVIMFSFIHGLFIYPYYDQILSGPATQIEKLPMIQHALQKVGIFISTEMLLKFWMFARPIKGFFLESFWFFTIPFLIYEYFKNDVEKGIQIFVKAIICSVFIVCLYGFLDIGYLSGSKIAENILFTLNPIVHVIKYDGTWWPPLLWQGQLRSLFAEPSYFGIYAAFAMPWLWYFLYKTENYKKKIFLFSLMFFFTFELFLTKARTANVLFVGELFLLFIAMLVQRKKSFVKNTAIVFVCALLAFGFSLTAMKVMPGSPKGGDMGYSNAESYLQDNLGSITAANKRSNRARYSILKADIAIGKTAPLLGVGKSLRNAYVSDYLPEEAFSNEEVLTWIRKQKENGIMRSGFPYLGEYSTRFAESGILGLLVYFFPIMYLFYRLFKKIIKKYDNPNEKNVYIFFFISMSGIMASGFGDNLTITCSYWIMLGLGYALILMPANRINDNEST